MKNFFFRKVKLGNFINKNIKADELDLSFKKPCSKLTFDTNASTLNTNVEEIDFSDLSSNFGKGIVSNQSHSQVLLNNISLDDCSQDEMKMYYYLKDVKGVEAANDYLIEIRNRTNQSVLRKEVDEFIKKFMCTNSLDLLDILSTIFMGDSSIKSSDKMKSNEWKSQSNKPLVLSDMNEYQKVQMTIVSYLELNSEGIEKIKNGEGIKLNEVSQYLSNGDRWMFGEGLYLERLNKKLVKYLAGSNECMYVTNSSLAQRFNDAGMGDLIIKNVSTNSETGFQAFALEDCEGNVLITYRGSHFNWSKGGINVWVDANFKEFFDPELSNHIDEAITFFDHNKSKNGNTAVFGASLGGNLASHVFAERGAEISETFVVNANPIDEKNINTPEKIAAFQSERYTYCSIAGDIISRLKDTSVYKNRIIYVENSHVGNSTFAAAHMLESISVDEYGNLIKVDDKEWEKEYNNLSNKIADFMHATKKWLNNHDETSSAIVQILKGQIPKNAREIFFEWFCKKYN